ncbi:hypothetical protein PHAVU_004G078600 [Phaseolus vulgaris]|uniref:Uncharacterized protein n=1 Tax=Phaseolus vulgaris TaxID=3885 RepID=V7C0X9_PHAVU|nr:hypothetical protein PHAVU_004G078600g [Phaseolus vulgaris]ESW23822.1 hypothetical protein PHAVU_004G078600g [Phaseolus vulgaris]
MLIESSLISPTFHYHCHKSFATPRLPLPATVAPLSPPRPSHQRRSTLFARAAHFAAPSVVALPTSKHPPRPHRQRRNTLRIVTSFGLFGFMLLSI